MNIFSNPTLAIGSFGTTELLIVLGIVILLFGAKKLPELAKGMGKSIKEFKKASNEEDSDEAETSEKKPVTKKESAKSE